jgi:acyl carrier protein
MSTECQIRSLVASTLRVDEAIIRPDATFIGDLGADSLALVSLILAIEYQFQIDIHDEEAAEIRTVEQMTEHVTFALAFEDATDPRRRVRGQSLRV